MSFKVAFIGAGSITFTRNLVGDLLTVPEFADIRIAFTDINEDNLRMVTQLVQQDIDANGLSVRIEPTLDRREALRDARYVINCARGGLVDLEALADAILAGKIKGAALDAFEVEGAGSLASSKIMKCENIVLTPHTGAESYDAYRKVGLVAAQNVIDILAGRKPKFQVNK